MNAGNSVQFADLLNRVLTEPGIVSRAYSAFHGDSIGNQLLALVQCEQRGIQPGPIATFQGWKDKGRYVRKGEKAITLCQPVTVKRHVEQDEGSERFEGFTRFVYRPHWFVLSQTDGMDLPEINAPVGLEKNPRSPRRAVHRAGRKCPGLRASADDFFKDKRCVQCGATERLELDHIEESTKVSHKMWSWSEARRDAELAKCQVLCESGHQRKSNTQNQHRQTGRRLPAVWRENMRLGMLKANLRRSIEKDGYPKQPLSVRTYRKAHSLGQLLYRRSKDSTA